MYIRNIVVLIAVMALVLAGGFYILMQKDAEVGEESNTEIRDSTPQITWVDSGQTFVYEVASRFTVVLDSSRYPKQNLICTPGGMISPVTDVPDVVPPLYAARFEAVKVGECDLKTGDFSMHIKVVNDAEKNQTYEHRIYGFAFTYPAFAYIDQSSGDSLTTGAPALQIKLARNTYTGTNLSEASVSVGVTKDQKMVTECLRAGQTETARGDFVLSGLSFMVFEAHDAAAGNRYDSVNYRTVRDGACVEIRELIHYGVLENYEVGAVKQFDKGVVETELRAITQNFEIGS